MSQQGVHDNMTLEDVRFANEVLKSFQEDDRCGTLRYQVLDWDNLKLTVCGDAGLRPKHKEQKYSQGALMAMLCEGLPKDDVGG